MSYKGGCSICAFPFEKRRGRVYAYKTSIDTDSFFDQHKILFTKQQLIRNTILHYDKGYGVIFAT